MYYNTTMFIDIHTHQAFPTKFPSIRNLTFLEAERLFSSDEKGFYSVGIHPWQLETDTEQSMLRLETWANDSRFLLVGECGLDRNSKTPMTTQITIFERQITLSEKTQKPMIIHCVGAFNELIELKKRKKPQQLWIVHGFRGKPQLAEQIVRTETALSFGEHFNTDSVLITPLDKLFIETDESTMSIEHIYEKIANIKQINPKQLSAGASFFEKNRR